MHFHALEFPPAVNPPSLLLTLLLRTLQAGASAFDEGAWESYQDHWRYFFECMLAPVPKQALAALDKLPITGTPRVVSDTPKQFVSSLLQSWGAVVSDITRGARPTNGKAALLVYALAPQHGPVVRRALNQLVLQYRRWAEAQVGDGCGGGMGGRQG
jgi:flavorubredoxin